MTYVPGQLHSVLWHGDGTFNVAKILEVDEAGLHVRVYAEQFDERPLTLPTDREVGSPYDGGVFGVGHIPVTRAHYDGWEPELLGTEPVEDHELDGYRHWRAEAADTGYLGDEEPGLLSRLTARFRRG